MPKWLKMIVGILLLPICLGTAKAVWTAMTYAIGATQVWMPMLAGAASWVVIFLLLPKPMWVYVFGHELTHAVWTWMFGGSVKGFKAKSSGGHVITTKNNFLIALAPYFFPVYAVLVVIIFVIGDLLWGWRRTYLPWFHLLLGAAYAFHVTLTMEILKTRQTDITSQGWFFSAVIIFLGNALVLAIGVPLLTGHSIFQALSALLRCNAFVLDRLGHLL
ncbi:MAG TPA: hypothetical protein VH595_04965 [Verrucomicrobiae bacterium]|jgi:hypothetical protein|nr:hypothetical protein [Verrucomicrobiae bacterium]